jgi:hypothetical protein
MAKKRFKVSSKTVYWAFEPEPDYRYTLPPGAVICCLTRDFAEEIKQTDGLAQVRIVRTRKLEDPSLS